MCQFSGDLNGLGVDVDGIEDVPAIAAGHGDDDGNRSSSALSQDHAISGGETLLGYRPATEAVLFMRIGAGQIDDEVGLAGMNGSSHAVLPCFEKTLIVGLIGEGQVEVAGYFDKGEVLAPVNREGEDG